MTSGAARDAPNARAPWRREVRFPGAGKRMRLCRSLLRFATRGRTLCCRARHGPSGAVMCSGPQAFAHLWSLCSLYSRRGRDSKPRLVVRAPGPDVPSVRFDRSRPPPSDRAMVALGFRLCRGPLYVFILSEFFLYIHRVPPLDCTVALSRCDTVVRVHVSGPGTRASARAVFLFFWFWCMHCWYGRHSHSSQ